MSKRFKLDSTEINRRVEDLISASSNRYRITVQVANRAKHRRYTEEGDDYDEKAMKPILHAIVEMSDELNEPEIVGDSAIV